MVRPIDLKFCIDVEYLESALPLGFIKDAESYSSLADDILREYLDTKAE